MNFPEAFSEANFARMKQAANLFSHFFQVLRLHFSGLQCILNLMQEIAGA